MAYKGTPVLVFKLEKQGNKKLKIELFDAQEWVPGLSGDRYRMRVNGKWFGEKGKGKPITHVTLYDFRDMLFKAAVELRDGKHKL